MRSDAELLRELLGARGDHGPQLGRLEHDRPRRASRGSRSRATRRCRPGPHERAAVARAAARRARPPSARPRASRGSRAVPRVAELVRARSPRAARTLLRQLRAAHPVEAERRSASRVRSHVWTYQLGSCALERVRLDESRRRRLLALLLVLDLDEPPLADRLRSASRRGLPPRRRRAARGLRELELAERLLELARTRVERRVRLGRDHRADELEREPDRARLERRQPRRRRGTCRPRAPCPPARRRPAARRRPRSSRRRS